VSFQALQNQAPYKTPSRDAAANTLPPDASAGHLAHDPEFELAPRG
jgi:hypothetical protein